MEDEENSSGIITGIISLAFIVFLIWGALQLFNEDPDSSYTSDASEENVITSDDAVSDHWDEIKDYVDGTESIEACTDSGCYDLDADISDGAVDTLYFNNGGYLYFYFADFDSYGEASDYDEEDRSWDFSLDMESSLVQDAISEWADDNGYSLE